MRRSTGVDEPRGRPHTREHLGDTGNFDGLDDLRNQFAIMLQEPLLFFTSIGENIAYARFGSRDGGDRRRGPGPGAHESISALPDGTLAGCDLILAIDAGRVELRRPAADRGGAGLPRGKASGREPGQGRAS